ncbi:MAG: alanine racemase [Gammaproteobacteria bacterium]|nr:alanine racemase [Gammaproteobacteria bacterium]
MTRATRADIHLSALQHNLAELRRRAPQSRVMAVIKANAYGHGIEVVAPALRDADMFAVASSDEADRIRAVGVDTPIMLLEGAFNPDEQLHAAEQGYELVIHKFEQLDWLRDYAGPALPVWLKVDTGMNRLGFRPEEFADAWKRLAALENIAGKPRIMTHLAKADELDETFTHGQVERLDERVADIVREHGLEVSIANSAGTLAFPATHRDWVRPGVSLYGVSPLEGSTGPEQGLRPVMTVGTELIARKLIRKGETIGYGGHWTAPEDMPFGVVAIGYGDGYPRHAPNGTPVLVNGQRVPLIGRVSMDMITVDLRSQPDAKPGDPVVLWGEGLPVEEIAEAAGTIPYELLCGVTQRVDFKVIE